MTGPDSETWNFYSTYDEMNAAMSPIYDPK